jgi:hypothetical protein
MSQLTLSWSCVSVDSDSRYIRYFWSVKNFVLIVFDRMQFEDVALGMGFCQVCKISRSNCWVCNVCPHGTTWLPLDGFSWSMMCVWISWKSVKKIEVSLKPVNNSGTVHENQCALMIIYRGILFRMRTFSDRMCRENHNTHFMFNCFIEKLHHLWENVEKYCTSRQVTDGNIIWHVHFACWITTARIQTHTHNM